VALGWGASALLVNQLGAITAIASPTAAAILTAGAVMGQQWRAERAQRRFIRSTFSRFVSPAVVDQLIDDPERIGRKPELRGVTCIFTDVAGFTTFIESNRDDTDLIEKVLNKYLSGMTDLYFEHGATIDKFIGDAVVGFFGGPLPADDHAERALNLSVELDKFSEAFRRQVWEEFQITFGETRIGIHTGEVLLGNFGSDKFFDYTAIGDTMNTAARLESANKTFGTRTCFSDATLAQATTPVPHRPIGDVRLKGKEEFLRIYELLSSSDVAQPDEYAAAFSLIEAADPTSIACFENLQTKYPNDQLIAFHLDRLRSGENGTQVRMTSK
jgi:adenylate cyclase